jgi:peptidoglycan/LPS O-acetylase OafA/YrhL
VLSHAKPHLPGLIAALPKWRGQILFLEGDNGVGIFFALSGFVIAHSVRQRRA